MSSSSESDTESDDAGNASDSSSGSMSPGEAFQRRVLNQLGNQPAAPRGRILSSSSAPAASGSAGSNDTQRAWARGGVNSSAAAAAPHQAAAAQPSVGQHAIAAAHSAVAAAALAPGRRATSSRASAQRATAALSQQAASHGKTANYPPAAAADCAGMPAQIYRRDDWEYGLTTNSQLLSASVRVSNVLPNGLAGLGLFASRSFAEGETLGFIWGKFVTWEDWEAIRNRHRDNTWVEGEENYVIPVQRGIHRALTVPMQSNGATTLLASEQCPIAYINQGHGAATNNVELEHPEDAFDADCSQATAYRYYRAVVRTADGRGVQQGEEFTTNYHWAAENFQEMKESYATYLGQLNRTKVGHLRGMYDCMRAQRPQPSNSASSVVSLPSESDGSSSSSGSSRSLSERRRVALEQPDRLVAGEAELKYTCCQKRCFSHTTPAWVTKTRSVEWLPDWAGRTFFWFAQLLMRALVAGTFLQELVANDVQRGAACIRNQCVHFYPIKIR